MKGSDNLLVRLTGAVPLVTSVLALAFNAASPWTISTAIFSVCSFVAIMYATGSHRIEIDKVIREFNDTSKKYIAAEKTRLALLEEQEQWKVTNAGFVKMIKDLSAENDKFTQLVEQQKVENAEIESQLKDTTDKATLAIQALSADVQTLKQSVHEIDLTCAYCNTIQPVLFDVAAGEFTCKKCSNTNAVHTNIFTARTNTLLK